MGFRKAERKKAWLKIALTGPSGAGKTYSALLMAKGMGGRIAGIDSENESMQLYAGLAEMPEFDVLTIDAPYTIEKYVTAIKLALEQKYDILIIDSISHAWAGEGGLLQQKEAMDARGGGGGGGKERNKFANWGEITKQQEKFKAWLLGADIHMFVTMRSKTDYAMAEGNRPVKIGLAPIQRDGMEYEFTTVLDIAHNHTAAASKDRTGLFSQADGHKIFTPTPDTGKILMDWLNGGSGMLTRSPKPQAPAPTHVSRDERRPPVPTPPAALPPRTPIAAMNQPPTQKQLGRLHAIANSRNWEKPAVVDLMYGWWQKTSSTELSRAEYDELCNYLLANDPPPPVGSPEDIQAAAQETGFAYPPDDLGLGGAADAPTTNPQ